MTKWQLIISVLLVQAVLYQIGLTIVSQTESAEKVVTVFKHDGAKYDF
jgi:hypothetical protein